MHKCLMHCDIHDAQPPLRHHTTPAPGDDGNVDILNSQLGGDTVPANPFAGFLNFLPMSLSQAILDEDRVYSVPIWSVMDTNESASARNAWRRKKGF